MLPSTFCAIVITLISFTAAPALSQPTESDIHSAISAHFSSYATVEDVSSRVFESADAGTGRVAVEGTIVLDKTIVRNTHERALFRDISDRYVLNNLYSQLGIQPSNGGPGLWIPIVESGRTTGFSGNLYYEEKVSDIAWEIDVSSKVDSGVPASAIPDGDLVRGSDEYKEMKKREGQVRQNIEFLGNSFIGFVKREIAGNTLDKIDGCESEVNYSVAVDNKIVSIEKFDLRQVRRRIDGLKIGEVRNYPLVRVTLEANAKEPRETVSYINSWMKNGMANIRFDVELYLSLRGRREIGTWEIRIWDDVLVQDGSVWTSKSINNFRGTWVEEDNFVGFRFGAPNATCTHNAFRKN